MAHTVVHPRSKWHAQRFETKAAKVEVGNHRNVQKNPSHMTVPVDVDARNASEAPMHYPLCLEGELMSALNFKTYLQCQTVDRWDRFVGIAGIGAAGVPGARRT